jgi:hypothetical protein
MARRLTARQLAFARLVSQGVPKVEALLIAYPGGRRSRATARVEACRLSHKPTVAAEIERLVASHFPEALDYARLMEQAVGTMMTLSETGSGLDPPPSSEMAL